MKANLWFRAKKYGWGWYPVSWQGWVVTGVYILGALASGWIFDPEYEWMGFVGLLGLLTVGLLYLCYKKGEKPRWRWGE